MSNEKEQAKLEIKEIIEKIKKGESPNTSRAHELISAYNLSGLEAEMAKATEEAAAKHNSATGKDQEVPLAPLEASKSFFDSPERKEMLGVHDQISQGDTFDANKKKPGVGYITRKQLENSSNTAIKGRDEHKKHSETLGSEINSILNEVKKTPGSYTEKTEQHLKDLLEEQLKHEKAIKQADLVQERMQSLGIETTSKLFKDNEVASSLTKEIAVEHKKMREGVDNIKSLVDNLYKGDLEKEQPKQQASVETSRHHSPPENFAKFRETTPVEYVNLGTARTPSATPGKSQGKAQGKAA